MTTWTSSEVWYTCPDCDMRVKFYPHFTINCTGTDEKPVHTFTKGAP